MPTTVYGHRTRYQCACMRVHSLSIEHFAYFISFLTFRRNTRVYALLLPRPTDWHIHFTRATAIVCLAFPMCFLNVRIGQSQVRACYCKQQQLTKPNARAHTYIYVDTLDPLDVRPFDGAAVPTIFKSLCTAAVAHVRVRPHGQVENCYTIALL